MTADQQNKLVGILTDIASLSAAAFAGPVGAAAITAIGIMAPTALKLAKGEEPTDSELMAADAARLTSLAAMNAASDAALAAAVKT